MREVPGQVQRNRPADKARLNGAYGVYVHIPFCAGRCRYCSFVSSIYDEDMADRYVEALLCEAGRYTVEGSPGTLYIGGGTPTCIGHARLSRLVDGLVGVFGPGPGAEVTVESNPDSLDGFDPAIIRRSGVNRVSLGAQSFVQTELDLLGRRHSAGDIGHAVSLFRGAGFDNIGLDLIYALPGQTVGSWLGNVRAAIDTGVEHISMYDLSIEPGTVLHDMELRGEAVKPDEDVQAEMYVSACGALADAGYERYEISNFAKPGRECRHNMNYWSAGDYVGLGASAHSHRYDRRWSNTADIRAYVSGVCAGLDAKVQEPSLTDEEALRETIMLGLRTSAGISLQLIEGRYGAGARRTVESVSDSLAGTGLVVTDGEYVRLTMAGTLVSNRVIAEYFS